MFDSTALARVIVLISVMLVAPASAQSENLLLNPNAEQGKGENPSIWERAWVPADGLVMERTLATSKEGKASLTIANTHVYDKPVSNNWVQSLQKVKIGGVLQVAADIRTVDADAANVCLQCWDSAGEKLLAFTSTPIIRGDQDWIRVTSDPVVVPRGTAKILVRAALTGKGKVWFDELQVTAAGVPMHASNVRVIDSHSEAEADLKDSLSASVPGRIVERVPISKDCMVIAYLREWQHGEVDNIAVANNEGGVRTLLAWKPLPSEAIKRPNRQVYLAVYSRKTTTGEKPSDITVCPVAQDWPEDTSWQTQPKLDQNTEPVAVKFAPHEGWKLFNITPLLRRNKTANEHGVMLKFKDEKETARSWSGYAIVSREGAGEWSKLHPQLLIIEGAAHGADIETK